jgi:hypothetical protein
MRPAFASGVARDSGQHLLQEWLVMRPAFASGVACDAASICFRSGS